MTLCQVVSGSFSRLAKVGRPFPLRAGQYNEVEELPPGQFKRLTGVKRETFGQMLAVLREKRKKRCGRPSKLSLADQLLLTLMYGREYWTQFHIAKSYGIHEANANCQLERAKPGPLGLVHRIIHKVEGVLAASKAFGLPGKRAACADEGVEL
jgi:hypothetical protein